MRLKKYLLFWLILMVNFCLFAQYGTQKRADNLFNTFSFVKAAKVYQQLIEKNYNADYATRRIADCYAYLRNPDSSAVYYKKAVEQKNIPIEYYYNYAQSLRGIKDYKESRVWMQRFKDAGGDKTVNEFIKDNDFITSVFNAKQKYALSEVGFNSKFSDFGAYEQDGTIYFTSSRDIGVLVKHVYGWNGEPFLDVYVTEKGHNNITHKSKIKGDVNSTYHDGPITLSNDGKTMYFSRNNFNNHTLGKDKEGINNLKIYKASLINDEWTHIESLNLNSDDYSTGHPSLNKDGTKLYFASDMPGGAGGSDIYYVDINSDGTLGLPQNLGDVVNTPRNEVFPFINNENILFFSSDGHQGLGLLDVFSTIIDGNNSIVGALNLGVPINSNKDDFSFFMDSEGLTGYIASNREGGLGSDDIYAFKRFPLLKVEGVVTDAVNNKPIPDATITLFNEKDDQIAYLETDENGHYEINIDRDAYYKVVGSHQKYIEKSKMFTSKNIEDKMISINVDLVLDPVEDIAILAELNTIYFDFDTYSIREDAALELDKIVDLILNEYPNMVIKIESHTDSRGTLEYNDKLSIDRANSTYEYLVSKGIDPSRITEHKGFGERRLTNRCDGSVNCEELNHQLNRRTDFIVIKME